MGRVIWVTPNMYVGTGNFPEGPTPEQANLIRGNEYLVLTTSTVNMNPTEEFGLLVVNDKGELWVISNRHVRVSSIYENEKLIYSLDKM
jgi:hypothetical protein